MMAKWHSVTDGEWVQPVRRGYKMACCDCGLVHVLDFRLAKKRNGASFIQFQARRDKKRTADRRRRRGIRIRTK